MEKTGRIIRMPITKRNGMQIATVQYDTPEADLCSIKSTDSRGGCPSCGGGCHACGKSDAEGLLAVQGNVVNALNVSGKDLWIGNKVGVFVSEKAARFQGICAVGIPLHQKLLSQDSKRVRNMFLGSKPFAALASRALSALSWCIGLFVHPLLPYRKTLKVHLWNLFPTVGQGLSAVV